MRNYILGCRLEQDAPLPLQDIRAEQGAAYEKVLSPQTAVFMLSATSLDQQASIIHAWSKLCSQKQRGQGAHEH